MMKTFYSLFVAGVIVLNINPLSLSAQTVVVGNGTAISVFSPLNRTNDYCVYEVIYLASQINLSGPVTTIGFQKIDGLNTDSIENVSIYLKHTAQIQLAAGNYDTTGYTLAFEGSFPNDAGPGWREVLLNGTFTYDGVNNLQVLISKGYQAALPNDSTRPRWLYTNINPAPDRARRYFDDQPITSSTPLTLTGFTSNARISFGPTGVVEINPGVVSVYPNPSSGSINFNIEQVSENMNLQVLNTMGQQVYSKNITSSGMHTIDLAIPGLYFYSLTTGNRWALSSGKIMITR
ncbi:MAG: T9SS type A sorting domain-containing protein [Bacteroidota bacterium]|nr:T9SS type A sorting domain-containing protein [Bacteroidota bacterium]